MIVVSGFVVVVSTGTAAVSTGTVVESVIVLSDVPETLLVELHADAPIIIVPAKARLRINFFIIWGFSNVFLRIKHLIRIIVLNISIRLRFTALNALKQRLIIEEYILQSIFPNNFHLQ